MNYSLYNVRTELYRLYLNSTMNCVICWEETTAETDSKLPCSYFVTGKGTCCLCRDCGNKLRENKCPQCRGVFTISDVLDMEAIQLRQNEDDEDDEEENQTIMVPINVPTYLLRDARTMVTRDSLMRSIMFIFVGIVDIIKLVTTSQPRIDVPVISNEVCTWIWRIRSVLFAVVAISRVFGILVWPDFYVTIVCTEVMYAMIALVF